MLFPGLPWQQEFEARLDYTETDDQLQAIREIKADMEKPAPATAAVRRCTRAWRWLLRAVMKCIPRQAGRHSGTNYGASPAALCHRHEPLPRSFPVTVEVLSRFRTPSRP